MKLISKFIHMGIDRMRLAKIFKHSQLELPL